MSNATWRIDTSRTNIQINLRSDDPDVATSAEGRVEFRFRRTIPIPDDMVVNLSVSNAQIPYNDHEIIRLKQYVKFSYVSSMGLLTTNTPLASPPTNQWDSNFGGDANGATYDITLPPGDYTAQSFAWYMDTQLFKKTNQIVAHPLNLMRDAYIASLAGSDNHFEPVKPHGVNFGWNWCDNTYIGKVPRSITPSQPRLEQRIRFFYVTQMGSHTPGVNPQAPNQFAWTTLPPSQQATYEIDLPPGSWDARAFAWYMDIKSFEYGNSPGNNITALRTAYNLTGGAATIPSINYMFNWCDNTYYFSGQYIVGGKTTPGTIDQAKPSINYGNGAWSINMCKAGSGAGGVNSTAVGLYNIGAIDDAGNPETMTANTEIYLKTLLGVKQSGIGSRQLPNTGDTTTWIGGMRGVPPPSYPSAGAAALYPKIYADGWDANAPNPVSMGDPACGWCSFPDYPNSSGDAPTDFVQYVAGNPDTQNQPPSGIPGTLPAGDIKVGEVNDAIPSIDPATGSWNINAPKVQSGDAFIRGNMSQGIYNIKAVSGFEVSAIVVPMTTETEQYIGKLLGIRDRDLPDSNDTDTWLGGNVCWGTGALPAPVEYTCPESAYFYPKIYRYAAWDIAPPYLQQQPLTSESIGNPNNRFCDSCNFPEYPYKEINHNHNIYVRTNLICGSVDSNSNLHDNIICKIPAKIDGNYGNYSASNFEKPETHIFYEGNTKYGVLLQQPFLSSIVIELVDHDGNAWNLPDDDHFNISLLLQFIRRDNPDQADPTYIETQEANASPQRMLMSKEETDAMKKREETSKKKRSRILSRLKKYIIPPV